MTSCQTRGFTRCQTRRLAGRATHRLARRLGVVAVLATLGGCAPSLSRMHPAHVAPKGHVQADVGMDVAVPTGVLDKLTSAGKTLARAGANGQRLSEQQQLQVFDAGIAVLAVPPLVAPRASIAYTPIDKLELELGYVGNGFRLGTRYQLMDRFTGPFDVSLGVGVARAAVDVPLGNSVPGLRVEGFSRHTLDLPLLIGTSRDWLRVWAGPRLAFTWFSTSLTLQLPEAPPQGGGFSGFGTYYGGQAGVAVGYRQLFLGFELTIVRFNGHAEAGVVGTIAPGGRRLALEATVVQPAVALMGEF